MDCMSETPVEYGIILKRMSECRVFDMGISEDGTFMNFIDGCDSCFGTELNKAEMMLLANELILLADTLKPSNN